MTKRATDEVCASEASLASPCAGGIACTENSVSPLAQPCGQMSKTDDSRGPCPGENSRRETPCLRENSAAKLRLPSAIAGAADNSTLPTAVPSCVWRRASSTA